MNDKMYHGFETITVGFPQRQYLTMQWLMLPEHCDVRLKKTELSIKIRITPSIFPVLGDNTHR